MDSTQLIITQFPSPFPYVINTQYPSFFLSPVPVSKPQSDQCHGHIRSQRKTKRQKTIGCCSIGREELISKLPDDILIRILSLLAPQEIIRCGVLSRRWTSLPKLVPMRLRFTWSKRRSLMSETEFTHQVNQVLDFYPGETLSELSISFHLGMLDQHSQIDKWVQFAMAKKAGKFSLDLYGFMGHYSSPKYPFPPHDIVFPMCTSLTDLQLVCVKVTNKQIKHFLECCPFLESLCIIASDGLTSLKVDSPIRLKLLDIQDCKELQVFEVSAPHLISFKYVPYPYRTKIMPLKFAPQLNELLLGYEFLIDNLHLFTSYLDHIVTLSLVVHQPIPPEFRWPIRIPTLRNLKSLTIYFGRLAGDCILSLCSWIEASPVLRRFVFQKSGYCKFTSKEVVKPRVCPHQLLKEFEIVGFDSPLWGNEFIEYIIENAVNLDKMVVDCRTVLMGTCYEGTPLASELRKLSTLVARGYKSMLSPTVKFIIM